MIELTVSMGKSHVQCKAVLAQDGNQWCVLAGDNLQEGICGFGATPMQAVDNFRDDFYNESITHKE